MHRKTILITIILLLQIEVFSEADPFDFSDDKNRINELGYPTVTSVTELGEQASAAYSTGKWNEAAELLNTYAKQANFLSNLIRAGIEPYYGASFDDRKNFPRTKIGTLAIFETLSNSYIKIRNEAMVKEALCYINLGDPESAIPLLVKSLDLIDIDNTELWDSARDALYKIIEIN